MDSNSLAGILDSLYGFVKRTRFEESFNFDALIDRRFQKVIPQLMNYCDVASVALCATNGKRTTLDFLKNIFEQNGNSALVNLDENVRLKPVLTWILLNLAKDKRGNLKDFFFFGFDAQDVDAYFPIMNFNYIALHNMLDNQKDFLSFNEKKEMIKEAIELNPNIKLVINADEPLYNSLFDFNNPNFKRMKKLYYGFENIEFYDKPLEDNKISDITKCPVCQAKLVYDKNYYSHLGKYICGCGFKRPELKDIDIKANAKIYCDCSYLDIFYKGSKYIFKVPLGGLYNAYNALLAIAIAFEFKIKRKVIADAFKNYIPLKGRDDIVEVKDKVFKIKVMNNPISLSEAIFELKYSKNTKIVFALSDSPKDSIDTSWIWGSDLDIFKEFENNIYLTGNRFDDMALRLKYAGVNPSLITMDSDIKGAIKTCFQEAKKDETVLVVASESLLDELYNVFKKCLH